MKTKEISIGSYQEWTNFNPSVAEVILNKHRNLNVEDTEWYAYIIESFCEQCEKIGFDVEIEDVAFSGFYSQGDGASFTGHVDILDYLKASKQLTKYRGIVNLINKGSISDTIDIERDTYHYSHENTCSVNDIDEYEYISDKAYKLIRSLQTDIEIKRKDLCLELYKTFETTYEHLTSDKTIIVTFDANEYIFDENGSIEG